MGSLYKKKVRIKDKVTGEMVVTESKKWWCRYRDALGIMRYKPLAVDQKVARQMLNKIDAKIEKEKAGLIDPTEVEMKKPILMHIEAYEQHLKAKGNTAVHVRETINRVKRCCKHQQIKTVLQIKATEIEAFLTFLRDKEHRSLETCNHYLRSMKSFTRWLLRNERINRNPLEILSLFNVRTDRRHDRRALSMEEFMRMLEAARTGPPVEGLIGLDRAMLYLLAAWTGFRKGELGSLTLRHFKLDTDTPIVSIRAAYSKRRREDTQVLHPDIVSEFKKWLEIRQPKNNNEILFPVSKESCGVDRKTSKMMKFDLDEARRFWIDESGSSKERATREASDYLRYVDGDGKFADFHALRHTFITNLSLANVSPKTAQLLARHSDIKLTMQIYTHVNPEEQAKAINSLPGFKPKK